MLVTTFMSTENEDQPAVAVRCTRLVGRLVQAGSDADGQPRLIIHATEEQIRGLNPLPLYSDAEITFRWQTVAVDDPVVFAADCPSCECCGEPWCVACTEHYADCSCLGPDSEKAGDIATLAP